MGFPKLNKATGMTGLALFYRFGRSFHNDFAACGTAFGTYID
jgi:hypothetical protein